MWHRQNKARQMSVPLKSKMFVHSSKATMMFWCIRSKDVNGRVKLFINLNRKHEKMLKRQMITYDPPPNLQEQNVAHCYLKKHIVPFALLCVLFPFNLLLRYDRPNTDFAIKQAQSHLLVLFGSYLSSVASSRPWNKLLFCFVLDHLICSLETACIIIAIVICIVVIVICLVGCTGHWWMHLLRKHTNRQSFCC